jgi:hypothetical protein
MNTIQNLRAAVKTSLLLLTTFLLASLLAGCTESGIPLSPEQMAMCKSSGCIVMTPEQLKASAIAMAAEHLAPVYAEGVRDGAASCLKGQI